MPSHQHHQSAAEAAKAEAAKAAAEQKEREADREADEKAAAKEAKAEAKAEAAEAKEAAADKAAAADKPKGKAAKAVPPTAEDPAIAKFREEFFGVENPDGTKTQEWRALNWVAGKETDTCTITSSQGTLANADGTVLTFPRPVAHKLATELSKARPGDHIQVTSK